MKKFTIKNFFLLICAIGFLLTGCQKSKKMTVGFYSTKENIQTAIETQIQKFSTENGIEINFVLLNDETPLEQQIKNNKIDAIITSAGNSLKKCCESQTQDAGISTEVLGPLSTSMRQASTIKNDKAATLPLLMDNLEIDIDTKSYKTAEVISINTWEDIEKFCKLQQKNVKNPAAFAGKDSVFFLDLLGALSEAKSGIENYDKAVEILNDPANTGKNFNARKLAEKLILESGAPLTTAVYYLNTLNVSEYLNPACRQFSNHDIDIMVQEQEIRVLFTTLSIHRTYNTKGIARFSTIYLPSKNAAQKRHFTANVTYLVPIKKNKSMEQLAQNLYKAESQEELSRKTGLAPVNARCRTPDKQADDVRYWISATNPPLAGLGHETALSKKQLDELRNEIFAIIF